jgi:single-strand DNA-binding protein
MTEFHELVAWAKLAEICNQYLHKGKLVYIEGYLKTRSWDSPEGVKKFKTEIVVQDMIMLDKRQSTETTEYIPEEEISENHNGAMTDSPSPAAPAVKKEKPAPVVKAKEEQQTKTPMESIDIDKDLGL